MRNVFILAIALVATSLCSQGQDTAQLKRTPYKLTVAVNKNAVYEENIQATAYVLPDNTVQLYPGETVYIEVEQDNGNIKSIRAVKEITNPSKTVTLSFTQSTKKKTHELTMLEVKNPFPKKLIYKATIFLLQQKKWSVTDVFPVLPGISGFETWQDIISSIGLGGWSFQ
jgi:hypothetical protein